MLVDDEVGRVRRQLVHELRPPIARHQDPAAAGHRGIGIDGPRAAGGHLVQDGRGELGAVRPHAPVQPDHLHPRAPRRAGQLYELRNDLGQRRGIEAEPRKPAVRMQEIVLHVHDKEGGARQVDLGPLRFGIEGDEAGRRDRPCEAEDGSGRRGEGVEDMGIDPAGAAA